MQTKNNVEPFLKVVKSINLIGLKRHESSILNNAKYNQLNIRQSIKDLPAILGVKQASGIVISGGPSVLRQNSIERIRDSKYKGTIVTGDASYISCLRRGLVPDFVLTLDPHPFRMVRWFGDPMYEEHSSKDDYFVRQDINVEFRNNSIRQNQENIDLVNKFGNQTKAIVATTVPQNVVDRLKEAKLPLYWWNPLVDDPIEPDSITRRLYKINNVPCLNTGGNVGTAAWVFLSTFVKIKHIALVGMDLGYYHDTPHTLTQTYYELAAHIGGEEEIEQYFREFTFPLTGEKFYTDPTYFWYRKNLLELLEKTPRTQTYNCTGGGTLFGEQITCLKLDDFLTEVYG